MHFQALLSLIVFLCLRFNEGILGHCVVDLPTDLSLSPQFYKRLGSRIAAVSNEEQFIEIYENEKVEAICGTKFQKPNFAVNKIKVDLTCVGNEINRQYNRMEFQCNSVQWNLYESSAPFRWCPPAMVSYILARPTINSYEYLAGICYNFDEMAILSVHYSVASKMSKHLCPQRVQNYTPSVEVENIATNFPPRNINVSRYDDPQLQQWMTFANYQNHSLIQNSKLYHKFFYQFGGLLEFCWWPALRLGNWHLYEEALNEYLKSGDHEYDILAGISGKISLPMHAQSCHKNNTNHTLMDLGEKSKCKIPLYVWQYLKSTKVENGSDLVVIGINTPFYDLYVEKDLIFCTDICQQIDWLQKVHTTFHQKTMGVIFCCSVDEVKLSKRLNGFPLPPKSTTPKPTTTTTVSIVHLMTPYDDLDDPSQYEDQTVSVYEY